MKCAKGFQGMETGKAKTAMFKSLKLVQACEGNKRHWGLVGGASHQIMVPPGMSLIIPKCHKIDELKHK